MFGHGVNVFKFKHNGCAGTLQYLGARASKGSTYGYFVGFCPACRGVLPCVDNQISGVAKIRKLIGGFVGGRENKRNFLWIIFAVVFVGWCCCQQNYLCCAFNVFVAAATANFLCGGRLGVGIVGGFVGVGRASRYA